MRGPAITRRAWNCLKRKHCAGSNYTIQPPSELQVLDEQGTWYFIGWYDKVGVPYGGNDFCHRCRHHFVRALGFPGDSRKAEPIPGDGRFMVIKEPDQTSVTVGDPITWTITIASMTDETLTLDVTDKLEGVTLTDEEGNTVTNPVMCRRLDLCNAVRQLSDLTGRCEPEDREHRGSHVWNIRRSPVEVPATLEVKPSCHHHHAGGHGSTPAEPDTAVCWTMRAILSAHRNRAAEQVIASICPTLWKWLTSHGVDLTQAANLANYLSFLLL